MFKQQVYHQKIRIIINYVSSTSGITHKKESKKLKKNTNITNITLTTENCEKFRLS